jgi:hypothetical protein
MKQQHLKYAILVLLMTAGVNGAPETNSPIGVWRGESVCATSAPSCHDEKVVFYIEAIPDQPGAVNIRADKIVDGKAITMGSGPWQYDRSKHTLTTESQQRVWLLTIDGNRIVGTLTVPYNIVFRRLTLTKGD